VKLGCGWTRQSAKRGVKRRNPLLSLGGNLMRLDEVLRRCRLAGEFVWWLLTGKEPKR